MSRTKKSLIVFLIVLVCGVCTACNGNIVYQSTYDDEGGVYQTFAFEVDAAYFAGLDIDTFMHDMSAYFNLYYGYEMTNEASGGAYKYYFERYLSPEFLAALPDDDDEEPDENYSREYVKTFFTQKVTIKIATVFYELYDYVKGNKPVEETSILYPILYGTAYRTGNNSIDYTEGFIDTFPTVNLNDIEDAGLYYIWGNKYRGAFGEDAVRERDSGYSFFIWDLSGNPDKTITYGQKLPNVVGWYTMLLVGVIIFFMFTVLFIKIIQPRIDKNMERIRAEKAAHPETKIDIYSNPPWSRTVPMPPDPFETYGAANKGLPDPFAGYGQKTEPEGREGARQDSGAAYSKTEDRAGEIKTVHEEPDGVKAAERDGNYRIKTEPAHPDSSIKEGGAKSSTDVKADTGKTGESVTNNDKAKTDFEQYLDNRKNKD